MIQWYWKCIHGLVFIHPASLCLLVGAFNPFTFKVVISMYDPITVSLVVWGLFSIGLFLLCFLPREVPLAFVVKLIFAIKLNSFNFCLSGKLLISPPNLKESPAV